MPLTSLHSLNGRFNDPLRAASNRRGRECNRCFFNQWKRSGDANTNDSSRGFLPLNHHFTAEARGWLIPKVAEAAIDLLRIRRIRVYDYREEKNTSWKGEKNVNHQHTGTLPSFPTLFKELLCGCWGDAEFSHGDIERLCRWKGIRKLKIACKFSLQEALEMKLQFQCWVLV